jgi:hypothetical protein
MEVCPPAEICRDAFERMSRATVRMGSKGFASQTVGGGSLTASAKSLASMADNTSRAGAQNAPGISGQRTHTQRSTRRPPTFDMDLSDLYQTPPSQQQANNPRHRSYQPTQAVTAQSEQYQPSSGYPQAYTGYEQSSQQQQQPYYMAHSPQSVGSAPPPFTPPAHHEQPHGLTDLSLDFLDFANNNINQDTNMSNHDGGVDTMGLGVGPFNHNDLEGTGINLGSFGLEADYLRDLTTDGSGYDLMDGYWFGMSGGGNAGI